MIIPIELRFKADKDSKSAFRTDKTIKSHDVNSAEFHITIDGLELTDNYTAKILSIFHSSKSQVNTDCEIVEGKIIYKPDTKLITRHEHVTSYVYVYNGNQSLDVREFIYVVDLSKIDETSLEVKEVYDQSYADLLADFEQALEDYKLTLPQADSVRAEIDEILNQFSEDSQAKLNQYDADVQQTITDNQSAFNLAESGRQENYEQAETARNQASIQAVADWEQGADALLETVEGNESSRVNAESTRETSEADRVSSESTRKTNETTRISNENARKSAESVRVANEEERISNEQARELAESERNAELLNIRVPAENKIINGNFSEGTSGWRGSPNTNITVENNSLTITNNLVGQTYVRHSLDIPHGEKMYLSFDFEIDNIVDKVYSRAFSGAYEIAVNTPATDIKSKLSGVVINDGTDFTIRFSQSIEQTTNLKIMNVIVVDLAKVFGVGNEPTKSEMDELIKITGYFDEITLTQKQLLHWQLKLMRQNRNALIALGGTII